MVKTSNINYLAKHSYIITRNHEKLGYKVKVRGANLVVATVMFKLTDAQRTIANSRVNLDEAMIATVTDKMFRTFTLFILWIC